MYSEDDITYDDNDVDYFENDDIYTDDDGEGYSSHSTDDSNDAEEDPEEDKPEPLKKDYTAMSEGDIRDMQEEHIASVCNRLFVSRVSAIILLVHFSWSVDTVYDKWFGDEDKVRKDVGLLENPDALAVKEEQEVTCMICFDAYSCEDMVSAASCDHLFCRSCWKGYIRTSISDGPGCLKLRCPQPSCNAAVGEDMVDALVCEASKEKYFHYLFRSYVDGNNKSKWCPAPGCSSAVLFDLGSENLDVTCKCKYKFCWSCTEEAHRPIDCSTIAEWKDKNDNESENVTWILANSKPCPKCQRPIEKNHGCMHMSCTAPCLYQFCWLCLGPWSKHGSETGGNYKCNRYEKAKQLGEYEEEVNKREMAKKYIEKYAHYYERWALNHKSMGQAVQQFKEMQSEHIKNLSSKVGKPETEIDFISDAWLQIIECRRVLKWTYAYGYYLPEHELAKKELFEFLQGDAESRLEKLHHCAEKELNLYVEDKNPLELFDGFSRKLKGLTVVTGNYFEKLVSALENGLSEVHGTCSNHKEDASSKEKNGSKRRTDSGRIRNRQFE
ncbi:probable E3 ubiquitin-protein ligase ARI7 [Papaver somniferum]|uniref:probable E3 ubiquitin-protein ligase ARI7 n=1 Tax=Papaver somniferum TaxID=3469 RepID=UPI000E6F60F2|nr:probable E3 ubiquitin-protein ligase ARI7 [Papaver somniferum]